MGGKVPRDQTIMYLVCFSLVIVFSMSLWSVFL